MSNQPPLNDVQGLAIWLGKHLLNLQDQGGGLLEGELPAEFDFEAIAEVLQTARISGVCFEKKRVIAFYPSWAHVFPALAALLASSPDRRCTAPASFALLDIEYVHGVTAPAPEQVKEYLHACALWKLLLAVADYVDPAIPRLTFLQSQSQRLDITPQYEVSDLAGLGCVDEFTNGFLDSSKHREQKRTIVRAVLIEMFGGRKAVVMADLMSQFKDFAARTQCGYDMYVAEFSFEKVKAEVEKDNLDSTLKLNKTFSDIQNQLLALPVTLLLVSGQMAPAEGLTLKNATVWIVSLVFSILLGMLIHNQRGAVSSINQEIELRKRKIKTQPSDNFDKLKDAFADIEVRSKKQGRMLTYLAIMVWLSLGLASGLLVWYSCQTPVAKVLNLVPAVALSSPADPTALYIAPRANSRHVAVHDKANLRYQPCGASQIDAAGQQPTTPSSAVK